MKKLVSIVLILTFFSITAMGCFSQTHVVGNGAQGNTVVEERQWYVLWGLVPINDTSSQTMAGGASDYTIVTELTFVDWLIGVFTGIVTVYPMTVRVTK